MSMRQFDGVNVGPTQDHVLIRAKGGLQSVDSDTVLLGVCRDEGAEDWAAKYPRCIWGVCVPKRYVSTLVLTLTWTIPTLDVGLDTEQ